MAQEYFDENLITRISHGDRDAFKQVYEATRSSVYGFALSILKNKDDAEDVMHDAYIKINQSAVAYRPMGKPMAWVLTIVRNLCYNRIRDQKYHADIDEYEPAGSINQTGRVDDKMILQAAMRILSDQERQIVTLHAVSGFKHREIAELLDIPESTVMSKYNRALAKMRKEIEVESYE